MNRRTVAFTLMAAAAWLSGCTSDGQSGFGGFAGVGPTASVLEVAQANGATSFLRAVAAAGLEEELSGSGPYTLFVPTNAAFRTAGVSPSGDSEALRRLIGYHVVPGQVGTGFMRGMEMNHLTSAGEALNIDGTSGAIRVDEASIVQEDIGASNGVVHLIDRVLRTG